VRSDVISIFIYNLIKINSIAHLAKVRTYVLMILGLFVYPHGGNNTGFAA